MEKLELRIGCEINVVSRIFGPLVSPIVFLSNLSFGNSIQPVQNQVFTEFFSMVSKNCPFNFHSGPVHKLDCQYLGKLV